VLACARRPARGGRTVLGFAHETGRKGRALAPTRSRLFTPCPDLRLAPAWSAPGEPLLRVGCSRSGDHLHDPIARPSDKSLGTSPPNRAAQVATVRGCIVGDLRARVRALVLAPGRGRTAPARPAQRAPGWGVLVSSDDRWAGCWRSSHLVSQLRGLFVLVIQHKHGLLPTDTRMVSRWAKGLMMTQAAISLMIIALLAAYAINNILWLIGEGCPYCSSKRSRDLLASSFAPPAHRSRRRVYLRAWMPPTPNARRRFSARALLVFSSIGQAVSARSEFFGVTATAEPCVNPWARSIRMTCLDTFRSYPILLG
jgi:hypothetical protein